MPESVANGVNSQAGCLCPFADEEKMKRVVKHWADVDELKNASSDSTRKMGELAATQTTLNSTLLAINGSLKDGFELGVKAVRLFGMVVVVFLVALVILALIVVYVARISIDYKDLHVHPNQFGLQSPNMP